jgi:hypothetical protein
LRERRETSSNDRNQTVAPKWQPAREFGARHIMQMQLAIISRASPSLVPWQTTIKRLQTRCGRL